MADYLTNDTDLTTVANAIRTKGGTSAPLSFPSGFAQAIADIPSGGLTDYITLKVSATTDMGYQDFSIWITRDDNGGDVYKSGVFGHYNTEGLIEGYCEIQVPFASGDKIHWSISVDHGSRTIVRNGTPFSTASSGTQSVANHDVWEFTIQYED